MKGDVTMSSTLPGHWWLAIDRKPEGPYGTEYVKALLIGGRIRADQPICRVGESAWTPISSIPDFQSAASLPPLPPTTGSISVWDRLLATVGWYYLVAVPALFTFMWLPTPLFSSDFVDGSRAHNYESVLTGINVILDVIYVFFSCIAGHGLLNQQKRAVVWATIVTVAGWGEVIVLVGLFMFLHAAAGPEMYRADVEAGLTPLQMIISFGQLFLLFGNVLFQMFALVVMWRAHPRLSDQRNSK